MQLHLFFIFILSYFRISRQKKLAFIQTKFILQGQESERRRISGELHDTIAQNLKIQNLQLLNAVAETLSKQNSHFGLRSIIERSRILGATYEIISAKNEGTEINIIF